MKIHILVEPQHTDMTGPSSCSNNLVVNCQKSNQENRRKQKISAIPPQLLQGEKHPDHVDCGTKLAPEQVIRRTPPLCYQGETPILSASPPSRERTRRPASRLQLLREERCDFSAPESPGDPGARVHWRLSSKKKPHPDLCHPVIWTDLS